MTEEERELKIRYAPQSVEAVFCEECECLIDDAVFDSPFEARDFAGQNLRDDGRILCGWCASPTNQEQRRRAAEAAKQQSTEGTP